METNRSDLSSQERDFLNGMTQLPLMVREYGPRDEVKKYNSNKDKYHCDPCDACGSDSCSSDNSCFLD